MLRCQAIQVETVLCTVPRARLVCTSAALDHRGSSEGSRSTTLPRSTTCSQHLPPLAAQHPRDTTPAPLRTSRPHCATDRAPSSARCDSFQASSWFPVRLFALRTVIRQRSLTFDRSLALVLHVASFPAAVQRRQDVSATTPTDSLLGETETGATSYSSATYQFPTSVSDTTSAESTQIAPTSIPPTKIGRASCRERVS